MTAGLGRGGRGVLLHPGAPKAATTAIQSCLAARRPLLREQGVLYPGKEMNHISASRSVIGVSHSDDGARTDAELWSRVCRSIRRHDGQAVVSSEAFAVCDAPLAHRVVEDLGAERVHAVLTLRALDRVVPSAWQESVKLGGRIPFPEWAAAVVAEPGRMGTDDSGRFWIVHDQARFVSTWVEAVGADRVTVVVLAPDHPQLVFDTFETLLDVTPGTLDPAAATLSNRSLTWPEAEVVRAYNDLAEIPGELEGIPDLLARRVLFQLLEDRTPPADETRVALPADMAEQLVDISSRAIDAIAASGARVIGDLDVLRVRPDRAPATLTSPAAAAFDISAHLLRAQHLVIRRLRARRSSVA